MIANKFASDHIGQRSNCFALEKPDFMAHAKHELDIVCVFSLLSYVKIGKKGIISHSAFGILHFTFHISHLY